MKWHIRLKNIAFPIRMAKLLIEELAKRIEAAARLLNLPDHLDRRPSQLSDGQRQRVVTGRAIVREPLAFLFDEPLSNLDVALRVDMRPEISELHKLFVAGFTGSPRMNIIEGSKAAKNNARTIGICPEHMSVATKGGTWKGTVRVPEHLGGDTFFHVDLDNLPDPLTVRAYGDVDLSHQGTVFLSPDPMQIHKFDEQGLRIE